IEVVGEATNGSEAIERALRLKPNVVLMDIRMPEVDGIEATRVLCERGPDTTRVLILTTFDRDEYVYRAMKAGASGFLLKDVGPGQLVHGVRVVASGDALVAPVITRRLIQQFLRRPAPGEGRPRELEALTDRETEILTLIAGGLSNAELAAELILSEATVKSHVTRIFSKLHLRDRAQAVMLAYESGLVEPRPSTDP
ncbi:MAG: response regulator, partial [Actinobacteria bacterium]|nr:response regulator [Actinomycetota bacterium]